MSKKLVTFIAACLFAVPALAENHYMGYAPSGYTVFSPNQYVNIENNYAQFSKNPQIYYAASEGKTAAGHLNELSRFLMDQLVQNRDIKNVQDSRVAVTSFVNLDNLSQSSKFGLMLSEQMMHQLHVRGFKVVDFKAMDAIEVGQRSDHLITRDVSKLKTELNVHYALAGTVSAQGGGYVVNARLISLEDQTLVSSAQGYIADRVYQVLNGDLKAAPQQVQRIVVEEPYPVNVNSVILRQR
ncbi:hypothetical protein JX580_08055 [Thiomicrospira microaerophila]|uniref:FlgO family outer membrane protein n=1 Tax=Thiomicrospira microaerophila TaxID=406020 RepID=UPI00200D52E4|nr:FlgO family outer membrane protein [Thiomicrospira microaerophila]UQB41625.1 hypothetical protein JX580_08055 [Thiomicrospira microaerophila]